MFISIVDKSIFIWTSSNFSYIILINKTISLSEFSKIITIIIDFWLIIIHISIFKTVQVIENDKQNWKEIWSFKNVIKTYLEQTLNRKKSFIKSQIMVSLVFLKLIIKTLIFSFFFYNLLLYNYYSLSCSIYLFIFIKHKQALA